jgi:hypothetical protein
MAAAEYNLLIEQGAHFEKTMTLFLNNTPIDLTNWTFEGAAQARLGDGKPTNFTFTKLPEVGTLLITMSDTLTSTLGFEKGYYNWFATNNEGKKIKLAEGICYVSREVK